MGNKKQKTIVECYLFVSMIAFVHILDFGFVEGKDVRAQKDLRPKATVKTIESFDGDLIDCVDVFRQPAFDNPLIKKIQMRPSSDPSRMKPDESLPELTQDWHKNGECPEKSIPIRRNPNQHHNHSTFQFRSRPPHSDHTNSEQVHEHATAFLEGNAYHGLYATMNVWNPKTKWAEFSLSQIWALERTGGSSTTNSIEAGWMVYPYKYGDNRTRFFIYWTRDNYQNTGCYDLQCPGFVQTSRKVAIGSPLKPVSTYKRKTFDISVVVYKDKKTGNWWLKLQGTTLGYWPNSIFTGLANNATALYWGGEITDEKSGGHHTTTQMGSGHFPREGYRKASLFRNLGVIDTSNTRTTPRSLKVDVTNPACYDLRFRGKRAGFYYGGPGYSAKCP